MGAPLLDSPKPSNQRLAIPRYLAAYKVADFQAIKQIDARDSVLANWDIGS